MGYLVPFGHWSRSSQNRLFSVIPGRYHVACAVEDYLILLWVQACTTPWRREGCHLSWRRAWLLTTSTSLYRAGNTSQNPGTAFPVNTCQYPGTATLANTCLYPGTLLLINIRQNPGTVLLVNTCRYTGTVLLVNTCRYTGTVLLVNTCQYPGTVHLFYTSLARQPSRVAAPLLHSLRGRGGGGTVILVCGGGGFFTYNPLQIVYYQKQSTYFPCHYL